MPIINPIVIDASHWMGIAAHGFDQMRSWGIRGVILKATQGRSSGKDDHTYAPRCSLARQAGLLVGSYPFCEGGDPVGQAHHYLDVAGPAVGELLSADYERNPAGSRMNIHELAVFLHTIEEEAKRKALLYGGDYLKETLPLASHDERTYIASHALWFAAYNNHPQWPSEWSVPFLWQFSGDGANAHGISIPGVMSGKPDINSFAGSEIELAAQWAAPRKQQSVEKPPAAGAAPDDERERARRLQAALLAKGFDPHGIDGIIGPDTVRALQHSVGFSGKDVDGIVGPKTRPLLDAAFNAV